MRVVSPSGSIPFFDWLCFLSLFEVDGSCPLQEMLSLLLKSCRRCIAPLREVVFQYFLDVVLAVKGSDYGRSLDVVRQRPVSAEHNVRPKFQMTVTMCVASPMRGNLSHGHGHCLCLSLFPRSKMTMIICSVKSFPRESWSWSSFFVQPSPCSGCRNVQLDSVDDLQRFGAPACCFPTRAFT